MRQQQKINLQYPQLFNQKQPDIKTLRNVRFYDFFSLFERNFISVAICVDVNFMT